MVEVNKALAQATVANMANPLWRICNIYTIKDRKAKPVPFRPKKEQRKVLHKIYVQKHTKIFIPKARQLGMSTLVSVIILDSILFGGGVQVSICDFVSGNARKKLEDMICYAFQALPEEWRAGWEVIQHDKNSGIFRINRTGAEKTHESVVYAGDKIRGGTNQIIHHSELGETQVVRPKDAQENIDGSMISAEEGIIIIETTWHGGKSGVLYPIAKQAVYDDDSKKDPKKDFFCLFFPWYHEKKYVNHGDPSQITDDTRRYFAELEEMLANKKEPFKFTEPQMLWYQRKKEHHGLRVYGQFPSTVEECFLNPIQGAILAKEIDKARTEGRVGKFPHDPKYKVFTAWDLGAPENTVCWYFQIIEGWIRLIDVDYDMEDVLSKRVEHMHKKGYDFETHFLPHDGGDRGKNGYTIQKEMILLGLQGTVTVLDCIRKVILGVNELKRIFDTFQFNKETCDSEGRSDSALEILVNYRWRPDPNNEDRFLDEPVHDFPSHLADGLRYIAEAKLQSFIPRSSERSEDTNHVFDKDKLDEIAKEIMDTKPTLGVLNEQGNSGMITFIREQDGWWNKWGEPRYGYSYILVQHNTALQLWSADYEEQETGETKYMRLVGSLASIGRIDDDMMMDWTALVAKMYDCLVVPTINRREAVITDLFSRDVPVFSRKISDAKKSIGRSPAARKWGFDLNDSTKAQAIEDLVRRMRDDQIVVHCPRLLTQLQTFIVRPDGTKEAQQGYADDEVIAAGIACSQMGAARPMDVDIKRRLRG